jgi:hypothetical protein
VQVDPIKPTLKPPGTKRLKLNCDVLLRNFAFNYNLRRYNEEEVDGIGGDGGDGGEGGKGTGEATDDNANADASASADVNALPPAASASAADEEGGKVPGEEDDSGNAANELPPAAAALATTASLRGSALRKCAEMSAAVARTLVGRCSLTVSKPVLKAPMVSAL